MSDFETGILPNPTLTPEDVVHNGLQGALFGSGVPGGGIPGFGPNTQNVSQLNNLFPNLRWYFASNFRQALSEAYCELGLIQTVVDVPVDDAFRGGIDISTKQLLPEQLEELQSTVVRQDDLPTKAQSCKWMRLFGGGAVLILTNQDPETPLQVEQLTRDQPLQYRAVDMWELNYDNGIQGEKFEFYSYYGKRVHKSRVLPCIGQKAPSFLRPRLRGWGLSVVEALVRGLNIYLKGVDLIYELIDEAKIDVYGIKNLTNTLLNPNGAGQVFNRIQLSNRSKNFQHALVMDAEDKYEQKQITFAGIAEVMKENRIEVASVLRMPLTKIFGISAAGFNSGEDDIEVYNGMLESTIRTPAKSDVLRMVELRCQQLFGFIPTDLKVEFKPLRMLSAVEEDQVKTGKFNRLLSALTAAAISVEEFRAGCNKNSLLDVQLEKEAPLGSDAISNDPDGDNEEEADEQENEEGVETLSYGNPPADKE